MVTCNCGTQEEMGLSELLEKSLVDNKPHEIR